jgi:hypothetical protein
MQEDTSFILRWPPRQFLKRSLHNNLRAFSAELLQSAAYLEPETKLTVAGSFGTVSAGI